MTKYQENLYSIDRALKEVGKQFMEQHFLELQEYAADNSKFEIKERLYRECAKEGITEGDADVRLGWATAIFEHGEWKKVPVPNYMQNPKECIDKEKIREIIAAYKDDFANVNKDERYKWVALKTYKTIWNIDAENFAPMLKSAYRNSDNLLTSWNYYPYKMLYEFAEVQPEKVRGAFKILFDEEKDFTERYEKFKQISTDYYQPQDLGHYQDLHAISVYLSFEYPDKYYIYKYGVLKKFIKNIGYNCGSIDRMSDAEKMKLQLFLSNQVLECIKEDEELIEIHQERMDDSCYFDEGLHLLTQDIMFYGSKMKSVEQKWYPSLEEYNPNLSKDDWKNSSWR